MNNRIAFIDFVRGLLTINPLERWSPHQAKLHPFITQQKYTGPFVPPMNLKSSSLARSPAPGTQQQQQAEALSKQRAQAAQAQANSAAQTAYGSMASQYQQPSHLSQTSHVQQPGLYPNSNNMYSAGSSHTGSYLASQAPSHVGSHTGAPPPYAAQTGGYGQPVPAQMPPANYGGVAPQQQQQQPNMYGQQAAQRSRQRASTMEQQQSGIPPAIQRVASHLDPTQPIRLQPSPAYYPPPADGSANLDGRGGMGRRGSRAQQPQQGARGQQQGNNRDFIRNLEERTLEEGWTGSANQSPWH
jgi:dual specificity protein kinase YAK1